MSTRVKRLEPCWRQRVATIKPGFDRVEFPEVDGPIEQDVEHLEVVKGGERQRIRFHDYGDIYAIPGLYEELFYEKLECNSPTRVVELLEDVMDDYDQSPSSLRVLDVGAGNGMVGDELAEAGVEHLVGVDIVPEAKAAAKRDRRGLYADYHIADLTDLSEREEEALRKHQLNAITCVAALGFGDIPPAAFLKALDLTEPPAWMAFNIKERFLETKDKTGFSGLIHTLADEGVIKIEATRRYCHRKSISGESLHYVAVIATKQQDLPDHFMESV